MSGRGLIVHEWIEKIGGGERVLDEFAHMYPAADVFTLWDDDPERFCAGRVHESALARSPLRGRKAAALPLMPMIWRTGTRALGSHDWSLVSSHLFAHQVRVPGVAPERHFVYAFTPARYLWTPELDERGRSRAVRAIAPAFRALDRRAAERHRNVAVVSAFVQERARRAWGVESEVVYPPVGLDRVRTAADRIDTLDDAERQLLDDLPAGFLLAASRFVPYKRLDVAITAGVATGRPVVIAGSGPEEQRLRTLAAESGADVRFVIAPTDVLFAVLLERADVVVFPAVEDFGILPVEALAVGTPVLVADVGGTRETVTERSGVRLPDHEPSTLCDAVDRAVRLIPADCRRDADRFSVDRFRQDVATWTGI